jgi:hypothetical protein
MLALKERRNDNERTAVHASHAATCIGWAVEAVLHSRVARPQSWMRQPPRCSGRPVNRRDVLLGAGALLLSHAARPRSTYAQEPLQQTADAEWPPERLCRACHGCGMQPCPICSGSGILSVDDGFVTPFKTTCPNCSGAGRLRCPKCIGLGLADTRGILRDGSFPSACQP